MSPHSCPKCRRPALGIASSDVVLRQGSTPVLECSVCRGLWIPHAALEQGVELNVAPPPASPTPSIPPEEDHRTGLCPEGHGILIRARAELDRIFHVERCAACRGVWLDRGEGRRLVAAGLLTHLDDLWDPKWQRHKRHVNEQRRLDAALSLALGEELFQRLQQLVLELREHPGRSQALAWLTDHLESKEPSDVP